MNASDRPYRFQSLWIEKKMFCILKDSSGQMELKSSPKHLHDSLELFVNDQYYIFCPRDNSPCLTINRVTGNITLEPVHIFQSFHLDRADRIYGIIGFLSLTSSDFVVVITGRRHSGQLFGHEIYRATDFKVLPLTSSSSLYQNPVESHLLDLVRSHLYGGTFWLSYTCDITRRIQTQRETRDQDVGKPLWQVADDRFFWNKFLHSRFIDATLSSPETDLSRFILPIIYGTFDTCDATINSRTFKFALISRRSRYRAGTRYFTRGIDDKGNVANYNETEQILIVDNNSDDDTTLLSFVQIRGSIPLFWAEINNLRYKPDLQIMELKNTQEALGLHFKDQTSRYGTQHIVNLVKQKGYEKPIKEAYEKYLSLTNIPDVEYDYFDFHRECHNMQWHRIDILIDRIKDDLIRKGFYHENTNHGQSRFQTGVVRTNCMDNLDRTNVVQSALARWMLTQQLRVIGILQPSESVEQFPDFMDNFRRIWADHADSISCAYSGTGALKTDFTRTGKRGFRGLLQDGVNSVMRYLKNNYFDGTRQDGFDIVTGAWTSEAASGLQRTLLVDNRPLLIRSMPYLLYFSIFMIFAGLTLPRTSEYSLVYYFSIWITLVIISLAYIFINGVEYVSWPRLNPRIEAIYYSGPGFRSARNGLGNLLKRSGTLSVKHRAEVVELDTLKKRID